MNDCVRVRVRIYGCDGYRLVAWGRCVLRGSVAGVVGVICWKEGLHWHWRGENGMRKDSAVFIIIAHIREQLNTACVSKKCVISVIMMEVEERVRARVRE